MIYKKHCDFNNMLLSLLIFSFSLETIYALTEICPEGYTNITEMGDCVACDYGYGFDIVSNSCIECDPESKLYNNITSPQSYLGGLCANTSCPLGYGFSLNTSLTGKNNILESGHCSECLLGLTYSDSDNEGECKLISQTCSSGQENVDSILKDRECIDCQLNITYDHDNDPSTPCLAIYNCSEYEYEFLSPTTTRNRQCLNKTCECLHGQPKTGKDCVNNMGLCEECDHLYLGEKCDKCHKGFYFSLVNASCLQCEDGYQDQEPYSGLYCTPFKTECPSGQELIENGNILKDHECSVCENSFRNGPGQTCTPFKTECPSGQELIESGNITHDHVCIYCENSFRDGPGTNCTKWRNFG